jgi:hypothetical protein
VREVKTKILTERTWWTEHNVCSFIIDLIFCDVTLISIPFFISILFWKIQFSLYVSAECFHRNLSNASKHAMRTRKKIHFFFAPCSFVRKFSCECVLIDCCFFMQINVVFFPIYLSLTHSLFLSVHWWMKNKFFA